MKNNNFTSKETTSPRPSTPPIACPSPPFYSLSHGGSACEGHVLGSIDWAWCRRASKEERSERRFCICSIAEKYKHCAWTKRYFSSSTISSELKRTPAPVGSVGFGATSRMWSATWPSHKGDQSPGQDLDVYGLFRIAYMIYYPSTTYMYD